LSVTAIDVHIDGQEARNVRSEVRQAARWAAGSAALAASACAAHAGLAWARYGRRPKEAGADPLLDRFLPDYDVADRHRVRVAAPADVTFRAACEMDLGRSAVIRAIFRARELALGARRAATSAPRGLVALARSLGWGVLAEIPGCEIVLGAVTQPWAADVVFRAIPPAEFAAFREPGYVKIIWTLRAEPDGPDRSVYFTETRAAATDATARIKFRRYWAAFSAGIVLIRRIGGRLVKKQAEAWKGEPVCLAG
jgi:hypothetical protein